ncbi:MAG: XdhC family protein [Actinomycetales bacterium]
MYAIALSVAACVRSGTRVDIAWRLTGEPGDEGLGFTPGGGKVGELGSGAFDGLLADVAGRQLSRGRRISHTVTELEATVSGLPAGTNVDFVVVPGTQFPTDLWPLLMERESVILELGLSADEIHSVRLAGRSERAQAPDSEDVICRFAPVPRLVVAGPGPIADAICAQGELLGWKVSAATRPEVVAGFAATLAATDAVVVLGHDVETSGGCLMAALESNAGYIGAVGSQAMQQARADWLAYRDVTDLDRVYGPAGLDIGSKSPVEVAVAIVAQIIANRTHRR